MAMTFAKTNDCPCPIEYPGATQLSVGGFQF